MSTIFNIQNLYELLLKNKRLIAGFVVISMLVTSITLFIIPKQYKSTTVIIPANPNLADNNRLWGNNIQHLYPYFGSDGDQDIVYGFMKLEILYDYLSAQFNLKSYYNTSGKTSKEKSKRAALLLQEEMAIIKTENNQLIITCWMKDPKLGADICNSLTKWVNEKIIGEWKALNFSAMETLANKIKNNSAVIDSVQNLLVLSKTFSNKDSLIVELAKLKKTHENLREKRDQLSLFNSTSTNAIYIVQPATVAAFAERPNKILILITTLFASLIFAITTIAIVKKNS